MHQKQWDFLTSKFENDRLSHAYLISGAEGIGKKEFVRKFLSHIACSFPDVMTVKRKEGKDEIEIGQVREVQNFLQYAPYSGKYKAVVVEEAERMNQEAQNCFLKTLEEPKGNVVIFLLAAKPDLLLPTIFSRCQQIPLLGKLQQAGLGGDMQELLTVLNGGLAERFAYAKEADASGKDIPALLKQIERYLRHLMLVDIGVEKADQSRLQKHYPLAVLKKHLSLIEQISNTLARTNASPRLALEVVLMEL